MASVRLHRLAILAAAFLFSTGGVVIKQTTWNGFLVAGGRSGLAALVLIVLIPRWRRFWHPRALAVGVGYAGTMVLFVCANKLTTAANAIFLQSTAPLYVFVLAPWLLGERNRPRDFVLTATLAVGMGLFFVGRDEPGATATDPTLGNLVAVASGVFWAWTLVGLRWIGRRERGAEPLEGSSDLAGEAVVAGNLLAFAVSAPFALPLPPLAAVDLGLVAYLGCFQIGLAYLLLTRGVERVPALEVSLLLLLEPVVSAVLAWGILGERPGPWALAGCFVIAVATGVRTLARARDVA